MIPLISKIVWVAFCIFRPASEAALSAGEAPTDVDDCDVVSLLQTGLKLREEDVVVGRDALHVSSAPLLSEANASQAIISLPSVLVVHRHTDSKAAPVLVDRALQHPFGSDIDSVTLPVLSEALLLLLVVIVSGMSTAVVVRWHYVSKEEAATARFDCNRCAMRFAIVALVAILGVSVYFLLTWYAAGALVKKFIEQYDMSLIGVQVRMHHLQINPFTGVVSATGLTVFNPPGWHSAYLLRASTLLVDVDLPKFIRTVGGSIVVSQLLVDDAHLIYERSLTTSNIDDAMNQLSSKSAATPHGESSKSGAAPHGDPSASSDPKVHLREVTIENSKVEGALHGGPSAELSLPDVHYDNFEETWGSPSTDEIVRLLLETVLQNAQLAIRR